MQEEGGGFDSLFSAGEIFVDQFGNSTQLFPSFFLKVETEQEEFRIIVIGQKSSKTYQKRRCVQIFNAKHLLSVKDYD